MISNLLGVVTYHTNIHINGVHSDLMGVAIFFVISGFIMVYITRETDEDFLLKRLIRIVPIYWVLTIAALLWFGLGFANPPYTWPLWASSIAHPIHLARWFAAQALSMATPATAMALLRSLTFWPTAQDPMPILPVGWTLNIEMFFYVLFAIALLAGRAAAPFISGAVLVVLFRMEASGSYHSQVLATWGHAYVICFAFGMAIFYLWSAIEPVVRSHRVIAITVASAMLLNWPVSIFVYDQNWTTLYFVSPSVVLALLILHSAGLRVRAQFLIDLGGASYSLYLIHVPILETLRASASVFPFLTLSTPAGCAIATALSCAAALICYHKLEVPLLRLIRLHVSRRRSQPAPAAVAPAAASTQDFVAPV